MKRGLMLAAMGGLMLVVDCGNGAAPPTEVPGPTDVAVQPSTQPVPSEPATTPAEPTQTATEPASTPEPTGIGFDFIPDLSGVPATIGEWEFDEDVGVYSRGSIATNDVEIVSIFISDLDISVYQEEFEDPVELPGGILCGSYFFSPECVMAHDTYGLLVVSGEGIEQVREIAEVALPLV